MGFELFLVVFLASYIDGAVTAASSLGSYNVNTSEVSVSGLSSGGAFAVQLHVAFSSQIKGVGSIAGVPYHCAAGQLGTALGACMSSPSGISVSNMDTYTRQKSTSGEIDSIENLKNTRVFIFSGTLDSVVKPGVSHHMETYYRGFVTSTSQIKTVFDLRAEHTLPTSSYGNPCTQLGSPYLGNCNYNGAHDLLNHIHGNIIKPSGEVSLRGQFIQFDQSAFIPGSRMKRLLYTVNYWDTIAHWTSLYTTLPTWTDLLPGTMYDWTDYFPTYDWTKYLPGFGGSDGYPGIPGIGSLPGMELPGLGGSLPGMSGGGAHSLDSTGYAYIPSGCLDKTKGSTVASGESNVRWVVNGKWRRGTPEYRGLYSCLYGSYHDVGSYSFSHPGTTRVGSYSFSHPGTPQVPQLVASYDKLSEELRPVLTMTCGVHNDIPGQSLEAPRGKWEAINDVFAKHAGYNEVAELNDIIVIYPQAKSDMIGGNPNGCWDWWGYAGSNYDTKNGVQMKFFKSILSHVAG